MFGIIVFSSLSEELYELNQCMVEVACDGIESLRAISEEYKVTKSGSNSYDIIAAAKNYLANSPMRWIFLHVKGHEKKNRAEFDIWERLNIDCDKESGEFREWCVRQHRPPCSLTLPKEPRAR
jgi:hypothetical protein